MAILNGRFSFSIMKDYDATNGIWPFRIGLLDTQWDSPPDDSSGTDWIRKVAIETDLVYRSEHAFYLVSSLENPIPFRDEDGKVCKHLSRTS